MNKKLVNILTNAMSKEKFDYIIEQYNQIKSLSLLEIGIDSLEYVCILSQIEDKILDELNSSDQKISLELLEKLL